MDDGEAGWRERAIRDAVLAGDRAAWRAWYAENFDRLATYVRWRCGGLPDIADDAIQETWLTAVKRLRSFNPTKGTFFTWLRGIASNAIRNALRSRRRQARRSRPLEQAEAAPAKAPDAAAIEKGERVATALADIPEHYEAVLRAKYLDQMTVEEIARTRQGSAKAVESLLSRARQAFREAYEKSSHD